MPARINFRMSIASFALLMVCTAGVSRGQEQKAAPSVDGTWKWTFTTRNGDTIESAVKLKQSGEQVTGTFIGRNDRETPIQDGKIKDGTLSFTVTREFNERTATSKYQGKVEGDTIKGTIESDFGGQTRTRDWEAKRERPSVTGSWKYTRLLDDGRSFDVMLNLKQEGEKVTGTTRWGDREPVAIEEGKLVGDQLSYQVTRERDGNRFVSRFTGKVEADVIRGNVAFGSDGEERTFPVEYERVKDAQSSQ